MTDPLSKGGADSCCESAYTVNVESNLTAQPGYRQSFFRQFSTQSAAGRPATKNLSVDHLEVIDLAALTGLTACDAPYLWLARKTGEELGALDKRFLKACAQ